jgi:hypothetical protein
VDEPEGNSIPSDFARSSPEGACPLNKATEHKHPSRMLLLTSEIVLLVRTLLTDIISIP